MSQRQWIVIIGAWVMIFLFLGFPSFFTKCLAIITGLIIIFFAYRIKFKENVPAGGSAFTDSHAAQAVHSAQSAQTAHSEIPAATTPVANMTDLTNATENTDVS